MNRPLTDEEINIYNKQLENATLESDSLTYWAKYHELMLLEGNIQRFKDMQKATKKILLDYQGELRATQLVIQDCTDKLTNGVEIKEEQ